MSIDWEHVNFMDGMLEARTAGHYSSKVDRLKEALHSVANTRKPRTKEQRENRRKYLSQLHAELRTAKLNMRQAYLRMMQALTLEPALNA